MSVDKTILLDTLDQHFGFRAFLEGQEGPITSIINGDDTVIIMPTGGGKSLCYQLPALILEGITVVVSPLIALMKDQVDALHVKGIAATSIHSGLTPTEIDERLSGLARGDYRLVYVAPERFKSDRFTAALAEVSVALFAIDEAHCISQWGHDFRPDYMRLRRALSQLGNPTVAAMTATATPEVREDIITQLGLGQQGRSAPGVFVSGFARHNLTLGVTRVASYKEKLAHMVDRLRQAGTGIVYCATRKKTEQVAADLKAKGLTVIQYHGGMVDAEREKAQNNFMESAKPIVVATNAFGMGIDRPDIRSIIHVDIPGSIEAYYQEAGRAGRDGEPATCDLLFNYADVRTQEFFIDGANPTPEFIRELFQALRRECLAGPIEKSIHAIAESLETSTNGMAAGSALYLLERAGVIERAYQQGSRTYTTRLLKPDIPFDDIPLDLDRLKAKRERDMDKLKKMIGYTDTRGCRHFYILNYFGDAEADPACSHCDQCLSGRSRTLRTPTETEVVILQKILSCVARMNGRYGRGRVVQTLTGSRSKEILDARLDQLSTYGLLKEFGTEYVWEALDALIAVQCVMVEEGPNPLLHLTPLGREVMVRKKSVALNLPPLPTASPSRKSSAKKESLLPEVALSASDASLMDHLRDWRKKTAARIGNKPAFVVFPDTTLLELVRRKPKSVQQLAMVKGFGPAKISQYGDAVITEIKNFPTDRTPAPDAH